MSKSPTIKRILREVQELAATPSADIAAAPLDDDLFEWHFTIRGPPHSVYADGIYHGRIALPPTYPLRPPMFRFLTPSGRFEANREICLSISGHHEETWQPAWGLRTALVALRAFMESDPKGQVGGLDATDATRRALAAESRAFRCAACGARTNAAILDESAARERQLGVAAAAADEVPAELKMAYRDELEGEAGKAAQAEAQSAAAQSAQTPQAQTQPAQPPSAQPLPTQTVLPDSLRPQPGGPPRLLTVAVTLNGDDDMAVAVTPVDLAPGVVVSRAKEPNAAAVVQLKVTPEAAAGGVDVSVSTAPTDAGKATATTGATAAPDVDAAARARQQMAGQRVWEQQRAQAVRRDDGVPRWVDRTLLVLVAVACAMILRPFLSA